MPRRIHRRRGATTIEFAIACPIAFFILIATMVGSLGVFRYQQVASLAREGARWASVHGADYARETGNPAATPETILSEAISPTAVSLGLSDLSCTAVWNESNEVLTTKEDYSTPKGNTVTVTVTYVWLPELYVTGPITLTSTSTAQMMY
jgi:Flp pilus assembly protein TadG